MDNAFIIALCGFLMLMIASTFVGYRFVYKPGRFLKQLGSPVITGDKQRVVEDESEPQGSTIVTVLKQIGTHVPSSEADMATLRKTLMQAGYRSENAAPVFFGLRIVGVVTMLILTVMTESHMPDNQSLRILFVLFGCMVGWTLPKMFVEKKVKKRKEIMRLSLPDALDMLVVSVEAGLGLDQAMQHVAREIGVSHPELSDELQMVTLEMRAGKRRSDALRHFAERTGEDEVKKLIAILIQNDRFGTSMGESLRTHSDYMRTRRKQEAEERAGKVGVKLVFPIFFFILPSMVIVSAGPGLLQIFKDLFPMMKNMGGG
jgi:tight adherence protein C